MKRASSNKTAANQQPSNNTGENKSTKRGTSSFSSKVPRFPTEKTSGGPSPGQYDPILKEKIKGVVPLSKQLPRSTSPLGDKSKPLKRNSTVCSDHSSIASFHSTRERSSSGSTYGSSRTPRGSAGRSTILVPFAPPKRTGIVRTATKGEVVTSARPHHGSTTQIATARSKVMSATLRANTCDVITRTLPTKPAQRLTSGNPVPGSTVVRKPPARPSTAGATSAAKSGATNAKAGSGPRASSATPRPKSRGVSPVHHKATPPRPRITTSPISRRSSTTQNLKSRGASPARRRAPSPRARVATSPATRKQSPSKREELQIKKELNELMARKHAQAHSTTTTTSKTTSRDTSPVTASTRSSLCSRSTTAASCSQSSSRTTTTLDYSSQEVDDEDDDYRSRSWSSPSSRSSRTSFAEAPTPSPREETPVASVGETDSRTRRVSTNSNQSDRTTTSWLEKERTTPVTSTKTTATTDREMPEEYSSLTYIVDDEPLRTPLLSCVRRYFTPEEATPTAVTSDGASASFGGYAMAPEGVALKSFREVPAQGSYTSNMFEVFAAGVVATAQPGPPHMGDHLLGLGTYHHPLASDVRPSQEMTSLCAKEPPKPPTPAARTPAGAPTTKQPRKEALPHSRQTPACKPAAASGTLAKQVAPKVRAVAAKARGAAAAAKSPRRVNETESFPRAEMKRKCSTSVVHSFTTPQSDIPVILQKGNKYYLPTRNLLQKPPPNKATPAAPVTAKRARTVEAIDRDRAHVTFRPRSASAPSEAESCVTKPPTSTATPYLEEDEDELERVVPLCVEEAEVEISNTSYEEEAPPSRRSKYRLHDGVEPEEELHGGGMSMRSDVSSCGFDIDVVCSENNLTITAKDKRPKGVEKSKSRKNFATPRCRPIDGRPSTKSILVVTKQREQQAPMKPVESEFRSVEKKSRAKSSPRRGVNSKCKSNARSTSLCESEKLRTYAKAREPETRKSEHSCTSSEVHTGSQSRSRSQSRSPSSSSKRSSSDPRTRDDAEQHSSVNVQQTRSAHNDPDRTSGRLEHRGKEGVPECNAFEIQLPKLTDDMQTSGNKPAGQYVRDSISLLDVIPKTAQKISETFHKMLEGMRSYLTDSPYINLRRNELHEQMMAYINEADGNAFYIRQEVKTELHRCVTQINANLQELLYLNNCVQEERQILQKKIEELHNREEQLANGLEEYKRLNEGVQKKCDDWAYRCRKEQETRRFIEGSKEMVEKEVGKQRKELRDAEEEVARLRREIKEFEKKLEEMKKAAMTKDAKFQAKLKSEEKTSQVNAELLAKVKDEKSAIQRTLHQMNESHIRLNNQNMAKIQDLEKQLKDTEDLLANEREEKRLVEQRLLKKDDYLKLVEGATINLVRQTDPGGRELPSMPEDFGLNEREVAVWEQLNLCRGRLAELEAENQNLQLERLSLIEKTNDMEHIYQWVQENEGLLKATQNEFTILEQPNAELVEEMEEMRAENKELKDKLAAREKHCSLAHEKIEKLQDLLNSLRISETEDADRVQVATLQHQITEMKGSMREMLERTKELDLRCASQEIQLKQRDYYVRNQQQLLETRNQVIEVLRDKGHHVSTLDGIMGYGDTWRKNNEPRRSMSGTSEAREIRRSPSQLAKNEQRITELEQLVAKLENDESTHHQQRVRLEETIGELELKILKAERYKYLGIHLIPLSDNIFFCLKRQTHVLACMDDARRVRVVDADIGLPDVEVERLDELAAGVVTADQFVEFLETVHKIVCEKTRGQNRGGGGLKRVNDADVGDGGGTKKDSKREKGVDCNCGFDKGEGKTIGKRPASGRSTPRSRVSSREGGRSSRGKTDAAKPLARPPLGVSCTENHNIAPASDGDGQRVFTREEFDLMLRHVLHEFSTKPELSRLLADMTEEEIFRARLDVDFDELRVKIESHLSSCAARSEVRYRAAAGAPRRMKADARAGQNATQRRKSNVGDRDSKTQAKIGSRISSPARKNGGLAGARARSGTRHASRPVDSPDESLASSDSSPCSMKTMCQQLLHRKVGERVHKPDDDRCGKNEVGGSRKSVEKPQKTPDYTPLRTRPVNVNVAMPVPNEKVHRKILPFDILSKITESPIESQSSTDYAIPSKLGNKSFGRGRETHATSGHNSSSIGSSLKANNTGDLSFDKGTAHRETRFATLRSSFPSHRWHRARSVELLSDEELSLDGLSNFATNRWASGARAAAADTESTSCENEGASAGRCQREKTTVRGDYDDDASMVSRDQETHGIRKHSTTDERRREQSPPSVSRTSGTSDVFYYPFRTMASSNGSSRDVSPTATRDPTKTSRLEGTRRHRTERSERRRSEERDRKNEKKEKRRDRSRSLRRQRSGSRHRCRTSEGAAGGERRHGRRREDVKGAKRNHDDSRPGLSEMLSNPRFVVSLRAINSTVYRGQCSREELEAMRGAAEGLRGEFIKLNEQKSSTTNAAARQSASGSNHESKGTTNKTSRSSVFSTLGEIPAFAKEFFHNFLGGHSTNMRMERERASNLPDKQFSYFNHLVDTSDAGTIDSSGRLPATGKQEAKPPLRRSEELKIVDEWKKLNLLDANKNDTKIANQSARLPPGCKSVGTERLSSLGLSTSRAGRRNDAEASASCVGGAKLNKPNRVSSRNLELASEYLVNKYSMKENVGQENQKKSDVNKLKGIFTNKVKATIQEEAIDTKSKVVTNSSDVDSSEKNVGKNTASSPQVSVKDSKRMPQKESKGKDNLFNSRSFLFRQLVGDWRDGINKSKKTSKKIAEGVSGASRPDAITPTAPVVGSRNRHHRGDEIADVAERPHRPAPNTPSSSDVSSTFELGWFSQTGYRVEPAVAIDPTITAFVHRAEPTVAATGLVHKTGFRAESAVAIDAATGLVHHTGFRAESAVAIDAATGLVHQTGYRVETPVGATDAAAGVPRPRQRLHAAVVVTTGHAHCPHVGSQGGGVVLTCRVGDTAAVAPPPPPRDKALEKYHKEARAQASSLDRRPHGVASDKPKAK